MSKQNSIDWLVEKLMKGEFINNTDELIEQAKAMHKEEVEEAYFEGQKNGNSYGYNGVVFVNKSKYYKQKFKDENNEKRS